MKVVIDIPDRFEGLNLRLIAGQELVAYKLSGREWYVKSSSCDRCGDCCKDIAGSSLPNVDGVCDYLSEDNTCSLGIRRPFSCLFPNERFKCAEEFKLAE